MIYACKDRIPPLPDYLGDVYVNVSENIIISTVLFLCEEKIQKVTRNYSIFLSKMYKIQLNDILNTVSVFVQAEK